MLRYLRENTGNWIIKIFLGIIVIVFVFLGVGSFGSKNNNSVATINDEPITIKEYQRAYDDLVEQMRARFGKNLNDDLLKALNVKNQAIESLIDQKIILAEASKLEFEVSKEELQQSLLSMKAFQLDGQFHIDQYKKVLGLNSLNPEIFEQNHINSLLLQKVRTFVLSTVSVSDLEARNWYLFQNTKIALDYLFFNPKIYSDIAPDEDQIKKHYTENKDTYKSEPKIKALYLKFSPEDYKDQINISDARINEYYEQNTENFKIPEKVEARHILIKVDKDADDKSIKIAEDKALEIYEMARKGQDFEKLAKEFSQGPSKDSGGYLGTFEKQTMVKPFGDQAFSMKAGEISKPVKTVFGWHIIKVINKFDASMKTLDQASADIKKELNQQELQNIAYYKSGEAFDAVIDGDNFEQVALIANKKIIETKEFSISGENLNIADNTGFARAAFELSLDDISDVKQFGDSYYLIQVANKIDPVVQDLDLVKAQVTRDLTEQLQNEWAKKQAQLYLTKAQDAKKIDKKFITDKNLEIKSTQLFTRNSNIEGIANSTEFINAGFTLNKNNIIYSEIIETSSGYYILGFKEEKHPEESEIITNLKNVKNEINWRKQSQSFQAWLTQIKKQYEIKYNTAILN